MNLSKETVAAYWDELEKIALVNINTFRNAGAKAGTGVNNALARVSKKAPMTSNFPLKSNLGTKAPTTAKVI